MAKSKEQKQSIIESLGSDWQRAKSAVLVDYSKIEAKKLFQFRKDLQAGDCGLKIVKKTLLQKMFEKLKLDDLAERISQTKGQAAMIFGFNDEAAPAKLAYQFCQKEENLKILSGIVANEFWQKERIIELAQLPSRRELLAGLVRAMQSPASGLVNVFCGNIKGLITILSKIKS
ncbi:MAG: 50S ribosomal protein L10 [Patescibacteria group bacterium]|nr:50S ribosomal protein L10 [Patescibacteria group bacterium]